MPDPLKISIPPMPKNGKKTHPAPHQVNNLIVREKVVGKISQPGYPTGPIVNTRITTTMLNKPRYRLPNEVALLLKSGQVFIDGTIGNPYRFLQRKGAVLPVNQVYGAQAFIEGTGIPLAPPYASNWIGQMQSATGQTIMVSSNVYRNAARNFPIKFGQRTGVALIKMLAIDVPFLDTSRPGLELQWLPGEFATEYGNKRNSNEFLGRRLPLRNDSTSGNVTFDLKFFFSSARHEPSRPPYNYDGTPDSDNVEWELEFFEEFSLPYIQQQEFTTADGKLTIPGAVRIAPPYVLLLWGDKHLFCAVTDFSIKRRSWAKNTRLATMAEVDVKFSWQDPYRS